MYPATQEWLDALTRSHRVAVRADAYMGGSLVARDLRVVDGSVSVDGGALVRRRCALTVIDPSGVLVPSGASDPLAPYGAELRLYRGIADVPIQPTGEPLAPLGVFRIEVAEPVDEGFGPVVPITGLDRASTVSEARLEQPYVIAEGTNYGTAIRALIDSRVSGLTYSFVSTAFTTPPIVLDEMADPWEQAQKMAADVGMELFFDAAGSVVMRPVPDPNVDPVVASYVEGESATLLAVENRLATKPGYNKFIVTGEPVNGAPPVRAEAFDNNPSSPTYYGGPYGKRPRWRRSQFITTTDQAQAAADADLRRDLGGTEQATVAIIPNPAHEAGDIGHLERSTLGVDRLAVVERFTVPLAVGGRMPVTTKQRRTAA